MGDINLRRFGPIIAVAALAIAFVLINPAGYVGGGNDDARYLDAARCWASSGAMCVPHDHWASRWPGVGSLAASLALLGDGRATVSLGALPWWIAAIALIGALGTLWFDRRSGLAAAVLLASVPVVANLALRPNTDLPELVFQMAALVAATLAVRRQSAWLAFVAGAAAGAAVAARDTSLLFAPLGVLAWWVLAPHWRRGLVFALAGWALLLGGEMLAYALATGDPLWRFHLAMAHGRVPSEALQPWVDTSRSPILNPDFIAGWKRPLGIEWAWPVDPWLNLLPHPYLGPWLLAGAILPMFARGRPEGAVQRRIAFLGLGAIALMGALIYVLAVDPKPRMFLLPAAAACLAAAVALVRLADQGRGLIAWGLAGALALLGAAGAAGQTNSRPLEQAARRWIAAHPGGIETDAQTRDTLALVAEAAAMPLAPAGRPLRLTLQLGDCRVAFAQPIAAGEVAVVDSAALAGGEGLCLLRYVRPRAR